MELEYCSHTLFICKECYSISSIIIDVQYKTSFNIDDKVRVSYNYTGKWGNIYMISHLGSPDIYNITIKDLLKHFRLPTKQEELIFKLEGECHNG